VVIITGHKVKLVQCYMSDVFHFEQKIKWICNVAAHCYYSVLLSFNFYKLSLINARVQIKFPSTSLAMVTVKYGKHGLTF
jgi:hypothetical protein